MRTQMPGCPVWLSVRASFAAVQLDRVPPLPRSSTCIGHIGHLDFLHRSTREIWPISPHCGSTIPPNVVRRVVSNGRS